MQLQNSQVLLVIPIGSSRIPGTATFRYSLLHIHRKLNYC